MLHIISHDNSSGNSYDGTWDLSNSIRGSYKMAYSNVEDGSIPITWGGANLIEWQEDNVPGPSDINLIDFSAIAGVTVTTLKYEDDISVWALNLQAYFDSESGAAQVTVTEITGDDPKIQIQLPISSTLVDFQIDWDTSDAAGVFDKVDAGTEVITKAGGEKITLPVRHLNKRPDLLDMVIDESTTIGKTTKGSNTTLIIPTKDYQIGDQEVVMDNAIENLNISLYRYNIRTSAVPMVLEWKVSLLET
jgi:hypothetical protein